MFWCNKIKKDKRYRLSDNSYLINKGNNVILVDINGMVMQVNLSILLEHNISKLVKDELDNINQQNEEEDYDRDFENFLIHAPDEVLDDLLVTYKRKEFFEKCAMIKKELESRK